jgi:hypothetical protein
MRQRCGAWVLAAVLLPVVAVAQQETNQSREAREAQLWTQYITPELKKPLWSDSLAYDAVHRLMVPMHAAFALDNPTWQAEFGAMFARTSIEPLHGAAITGSAVRNRLMFLHLASRFAVLAGPKSQLVSPGLIPEIDREIYELWEIEGPGRLQQTRARGMRGLIARALAEGMKPSGALTDYERMILAVAGDLKNWELQSGRSTAHRGTVDEILDVSRRVFTEHVVKRPDGGWLFEPGLRSETPDYLYAGQTKLVRGMRLAVVPDLALDASHSVRFPLWLLSLAGAYPKNAPESIFYRQLADGLAIQFFRHVLVPPGPDFPTYRTTNYMDGRNGVYRSNYQDRGEEWGYGPFELSGALDLGWWAFLPSPCAVQLYRGMSASFPRGKDVMDTYTARRYKPGAGNWHETGQAELNTLLAADVASSLLADWPSFSAKKEAAPSSCPHTFSSRSTP